jgi:hypothetical protein
MDLEQVREKLEYAKGEVSNASSRASDLRREADYLETDVDSAYNTIDDILDNLTEYQTIDIDQHRMLIRFSGRIAKLSHYLYRAIIDGTTGSTLSNEDETRAREAMNILDRLYNLDPIEGDGTPNKSFVVEYDYNEYAWIVKQKKEEVTFNG